MLGSAATESGVSAPSACSVLLALGFETHNRWKIFRDAWRWPGADPAYPLR